EPDWRHATGARGRGEEGEARSGGGGVSAVLRTRHRNRGHYRGSVGQGIQRPEGATGTGGHQDQHCCTTGCHCRCHHNPKAAICSPTH
ncbi:hypothetical protein ABWU59_31665, partial [Priestia megaterium]|uniref:hypothetical protein n=1 Tax=Priestia megaterium TaxID=1404 RepID=UPI003399A0FE